MQEAIERSTTTAAATTTTTTTTTTNTAQGILNDGLDRVVDEEIGLKLTLLGQPHKKLNGVSRDVKHISGTKEGEELMAHLIRKIQLVLNVPEWGNQVLPICLGGKKLFPLALFLM